MKTYLELIEHCKQAANWKYVYGAKGSVLTLQQIKNLQSMYGKSYVWDSDLNKAGNICCDCSGLISSCTGILRGSTEYKDTATQTATISQLKANWYKYIGWGIWMKGHIGVVSEKEGYYYAMDGSSRNWSHRPLKDNNWTKIIKLKDINYNVSTYPHYVGHIQGIGWDKKCIEGETCGTTGRSLRLEAIKVDYPNVDIYAMAHIQRIGNVDYGKINADTVIGTVGKALRLEALYLKGPIQIRAHLQGIGWTKWVACDKGTWIGTMGQSRRMEAVEIKRL